MKIDFSDETSFEFLPNRRAVRDARLLDLRTADVMTLVGELFWTWVQIRILGVDLLHCGQADKAYHELVSAEFDPQDKTIPPCGGGCGWEYVPLLAIALGPIWCMTMAKSQGRYRCPILVTENLGDLTFEMNGDVVAVQNHLLRFESEWVRMPWSELYERWQEFASEVRAYLVAELPDLRDNPVHAGWFRGGPYHPELDT
jgi:hypothetical protein